MTRHTAWYLSHPQVAIEPAVPVPKWGLSDAGRERARTFAGAAWTSGIARIVASAERKAIETATIIADRHGLSVESDPAFNENDRSATGYLPAEAFEAMADAFFAVPETSVRGWERAIDAQARIVSAIDRALDSNTAEGDVLFVGHGAVGTLLLCHLGGFGVARAHDQPAGGGYLFAFDIATRRLISGWQPAKS